MYFMQNLGELVGPQSRVSHQSGACHRPGRDTARWSRAIPSIHPPRETTIRCRGSDKWWGTHPCLLSLLSILPPSSERSSSLRPRDGKQRGNGTYLFLFAHPTFSASPRENVIYDTQNMSPSLSRVGSPRMLYVGATDYLYIHPLDV